MTGLRLRHVAQVNPPTPEFDAAPDDAEVTFVPLEAVWPRALDVSRTRTKADVAQGYTRFCEGDVLVPKITPTFEADRSTIAVGLRNSFGAGTTELHVVRPGPSIDRRYLNYLVSSRGFLLGGEAEMIGVAGQKRVPDAWLRNFHVPIQSSSGQRAIADFLDAETARIDALIDKKRALVDSVGARWRADLLSRLTVADEPGFGGTPWVPDSSPDGWAVVPLKRLISRSWGGDWGDEPGGAEVDLPCVRAADFEFADLRAVSGTLRSFAPAAVASRLLAPGDLVIEKSGGGEGVAVGRVVAWRGDTAAVPTNFAGGLRPVAGVAADFVLLVFRAAYEVGLPWRSIKQTTGLQNLDVGHYLAHPWVVPPFATQRRVADELLQSLSRVRQVQAGLLRQVDLIEEHRQALITAAVTGEQQVPGVAA